MKFSLTPDEKRERHKLYMRGRRAQGLRETRDAGEKKKAKDEIAAYLARVPKRESWGDQ